MTKAGHGAHTSTASSDGGMATALSIDQVDAPSLCLCKENPELEVSFISLKEDGASLPTSARTQEIFIDWICLQKSQLDVCFLLDPRFELSLDGAHRAFKACIKEMLVKLPQECHELAVYRKFRDFLADNMGLSSSFFLEKGPTRADAAVEELENNNPIPVSAAAAYAASIANRDSSGNAKTNINNADPDNKPATPGHVFIVNASVCDLACDAFLCPCTLGKNESIAGRIFVRWRQQQQTSYPQFYSHLVEKAKPSTRFPRKHYRDYPSAATLRDWPWNEFDESTTMFPAPLPLLVAGHVGYVSSKKLPSTKDHLQALERTVRDVIAVAMEELCRNQPQPRYKRERFLIAIPVVGTGGSGGKDLTGLVLERLLSVLREFAAGQRHINVDCVLVCADDATYALAQQMRLSQIDSYPCFQALEQDETLKREASRLSYLAAEGQLSLFLGAGTSVGSGLPTWFEFLGILEDFFTENGESQERRLGDMLGWDSLVMAAELESICNARNDRHGLKKPLKLRVQELLCGLSQNPGILLYLLLSLSAKTMVTQNYDQLIERAMECRSVADPLANTSLSIIPYGPIRGASRWLLKMHGCVSVPDDIVITRQDYAAFEAGRLRTLSGLVQAI